MDSERKNVDKVILKWILTEERRSGDVVDTTIAVDSMVFEHVETRTGIEATVRKEKGAKIIDESRFHGTNLSVVVHYIDQRFSTLFFYILNPRPPVITTSRTP